jgi:beta-lactamase superfamily II metal-dependent hydrolase
MMIKSEKIEPNFIWTYLIDLGRHDLIELMAKSDKKEIKKIKVKRMLVPDLIIHNTIIKYLENNGVRVIREDIKR